MGQVALSVGAMIKKKEPLIGVVDVAVRYSLLKNVRTKEAQYKSLVFNFNFSYLLLFLKRIWKGFFNIGNLVWLRTSHLVLKVCSFVEYGCGCAASGGFLFKQTKLEDFINQKHCYGHSECYRGNFEFPFLDVEST